MHLRHLLLLLLQLHDAEAEVQKQSGMLMGGPGSATVAPMADLGQWGDIKHSSQSNYPIYFVFCAAEPIWSNRNARKTSGGCGGGELTAPYQDLWWRRDSFPSVRT